jgi:hypothetical protein
VLQERKLPAQRCEIRLHCHHRGAVDAGSICKII